MKSSLFGEMQVEICRNKTVESSTYLLCASDVEGRVAVGSVTLNTSSSSSFFTDVARQFPTCSRNVVNTVDRFQEYLNNYGKKKETLQSTFQGKTARNVNYSIGEADFWYPQSANDMGPSVVIRLFEGSSSIGTQSAINCS